MKGVNKLCCGLLLVFSIMLGLLFAGSSDVSALKYELEYIPFYTSEIPNNSGHELYEPFRWHASSSLPTDSFLGHNTARFHLNWDSNSGKCVYSFWRYLDSYASDDTLDSLVIPSYINPIDGVTSDSNLLDSNMSYCSPDGISSHVDEGSIPTGGLQVADFPLRSYLPRRFAVNGAYLKSTATNDGLYASTKFNFVDLYRYDFNSVDGPDPTIFNVSLPSLTYLSLPIGSSFVPMSSGSPLQVSGRFYFDTVDGTSPITYDSSTPVTLSSNFYSDYNHYLTPATSYSVASSTCSTSFTANSNPDEYPYYFDFTCSLTVPIDSSFSGHTLTFGSGLSSSSPIWSSSSNFKDIVFDNITVVTNNDFTPADHSFQNFEISSISEDIIPGWAGGTYFPNIVTNGFDWSESLKNLFGFNFSNPFQPIFSMFSPDSNCASIPTLAGMLHSEESTVCPWFSSETRSILTPVLSLASMMLLFGFAVRWLGARSGNFVEDSGGIDSGGFHFENKFRRKK